MNIQQVVVMTDTIFVIGGMEIEFNKMPSNNRTTMKARIIATGEIVEVYEYSKIGGYIKYDIDNKIADINDVEIISNDYDGIDWEQRRYEIAKDLLAALHTMPIKASEFRVCALGCVQAAEILIEELKGGEQ